MKTRMGFVANSSSSSFMCPKENFNSIFDLGTQMISQRNVEWAEEDGQINEQWIQEIPKIQRAIELGINPDTPIQFDSTNYDTFIRLSADGRFYEVDTCNNQDWRQIDALRDRTVSWSEGEDFSSVASATYFWWIRSGVFGRPIKSEDEIWKQYRRDNKIQDSWPSCGKRGHYDGIVETADRKVVCPTCYLLEKGPDMILKPAATLYRRPQYILKPRLKLR